VPNPRAIRKPSAAWPLAWLVLLAGIAWGAPAHANILIPLSVELGLRGILVWWILPATVVLEAAVILILLRLPFATAIWIALLLNVASTFAGVILIPLVGIPIEVELDRIRSIEPPVVFLMGTAIAWALITVLNTAIEYGVLKYLKVGPLFEAPTGWKAVKALMVANLLSSLIILIPFAAYYLPRLPRM